MQQANRIQENMSPLPKVQRRMEMSKMQDSNTDTQHPSIRSTVRTEYSDRTSQV